MKEELEKKGQSMVVPFLVGGMVGAGIALLLAPKAGSEVRKDIKDFAVNTKGAISATIEKGRELFDESRTALNSAIDAGRTAYVEEKERHIKAA